jgi:PAS domain S-box-containing protein
MELSAQAYEELVAETVDMLTVVDESGTVQYASPSVERITGQNPDGLVGDTAFEYIHPEDRQPALETLREVVEATHSYTTASVEVRWRHEDGSWVWLEARGSSSAGTTLDGYVISARDITARKEYERKLQQERDRLDRFASVVSHDLRNPLNVVEGHLDLARNECESEHLDVMAESLDRVDELIEDLLTLAREGEAEPQLDGVYLPEVAGGCWRNLDTEDASIDVETDATVVADESQLKQVLENLFRNAIEHGGDDVTITVGALGDGFYVEDDGRGIPDDARDSILDYGFSTKTDGTGFGLTIVDEIVENHGWILHVADGDGGGARFEVRGVTFADPSRDQA